MPGHANKFICFVLRMYLKLFLHKNRNSFSFITISRDTFYNRVDAILEF